MNARELFDKLREHLTKVSNFNYAVALLDWDQKTYMPREGLEGRAAIVGTVDAEGFKLFTSDTTRQLLSELQSIQNDLTPVEQALIKFVQRSYQRATKIPPKLYEEFSVLRLRASGVWKEAKEGSDFKMFAPILKQIIEKTKEFAEFYGYEKNPYDALLPSYEPGVTTEELNALMTPLREHLVLILQKLKDSPYQPDNKILLGHFPVRKQKKFLREILDTIGFNRQKGRLDKTEHPFMTRVGPDDCRLTTKYHTDNLAPAVTGLIHEAGHGLFEQGRKLFTWLHIEGHSMGLSESQSRLWENVVGRSLFFWRYFYPKLQEVFPDFREISIEKFYQALNVVKPSLIRIHADELTYPLHIMLRFEIEEALINNRVQVDDLPAIWSEKMRDYLGVVPQNDREGVLQDIHWSLGYIGYFPTYLLGSLAASQFYEAMRNRGLCVVCDISRGKFVDTLTWLQKNIYFDGFLYTLPEILEKVTREKLNHKHWLSYIATKFGEIYRI